MPPTSMLRFGPFELNLSEERLWHGSETVPLTAKAFALLHYLAQHPQRLLTRNDLFDAVWPETYVSDGALTACIGELRRALADSAQTPQFIETVRGRGYRFVAEVTMGESEPNSVPDPAPVAPDLEPAPDTTPFVPMAERRPLTVLFCDLVESTALSEQLDPEALHEVLSAYHTTCVEVIERFGGHVAQYLGDGLLTYFGYPHAQEDAARRAVHAGLGIVRAMASLNQRLSSHQVSLATRIGIHSGLVVMGEVGAGRRVEQLAVGLVPNVAARLQALASPDTVVVSAATYDLIEGYFVCEHLGEQDLRGVVEPMAVYQVLRGSGTQSPLERTRTLTPLVGREQEIGLLLEAWQRALNGQGQVVLLSGEAGIGKSRLVQVLKEQTAHDATQLECRSSPYYQNTALYPITNLLQRALQWQPNDAPEVILETLEQRVNLYGLPLAETIPFLAPLLSLSLPKDRYPPLHLSPQRHRQRTLETIVALVLARSEQQPVLFIIEDLHWLDPTSLELLDLLIDQTPTASLCVLLTCRPTFQAPWGSRSYLTPMTLHRLSQSQVAQMAEHLAAGKRLSAEVCQQLIAKTDGVPLFVEEMTKAILESGYLKEADGHNALTEALPALAIPATLQDALMARLDRLMSAKGIAQMAAVIGRQFAYDLLEALTPIDGLTLQSELRRLVEAELVYQRGVPPQATYQFKHALVRDAAYESLLVRTRQAYHQRIAQVLEEQFAATVEMQPELVAHHYTGAGLAELAISYWQRAGQRASDRSAYQEAISHLTTGLSLLRSLPESLARHQRELPLQMALGTASLIARGHTAPEVEAAYTRARSLCQQLGDTQDVFPVLFGLCRFYLMRSDLDLTRQLGKALLALAEQQDEAPLYVMAHYALGVTCLFLGELLAAHRHLEAGIARDTQTQPRSRLFWAAGHDPGVTCRGFSAGMLWVLGYPDQALARTHETLDLATKIDHPFSTAFALLLASMVSLLRRERQDVHRHAQAGVTLSSEQGFPLWLAGSMISRGWALTVQGQKEEGVRQMRQGLTNWRAAGAELYVPPFLTILAEGYGALEQVEAGLEALKDGLEVMERTGEHWWQAEVHRVQGTLRLQQAAPDVAEAETCFHQALAVARQQEAKSLELRAATSLARLWQSQDKRQDAYDLLAPVYGWFTEGFDTADLIDAKALLDELS